MSKNFRPFLPLILCLLAACEETPSTPAVTAPSASARPSGAKPSNVDAMIDQLAGTYARHWKLASRGEGGGDNTQDCYRDDQVLFYRDFRVSFDVGKNACRRGDLVEKNQTGRWQPTATFDMLIFINNEAPYKVQVLSLDGERLSLSFIDVDGTEVTETYTKGEDMQKDTPASASPSPKASATPRPAGTPAPRTTPTPIILD